MAKTCKLYVYVSARLYVFASLLQPKKLKRLQDTYLSRKSTLTPKSFAMLQEEATTVDWRGQALT